MVDVNYVKGLGPGVIKQLAKQNRTARYFSNPEMWALDHLGIILWDAQAEAAMSVVDNKNTAIKAGHEVGKSFLAATLIMWWIDTRWELPGGCFVVTTAPSVKQLNAVVWREVRKFHKISRERHVEYLRRVREDLPLGDYEHNDHQLPGYITADAHWRLPDGIELGYGAKPPDHDDDSMSGIHARYVLAIGDEAVGLTENLIESLHNITTNATSRRFIICNPTNPLSHVGKIFKQNTGTWALRTISVFDSPNFHGGGTCPDNCPRKFEHDQMPKGLGLSIDALESMVDQSYVDDMLRDYGEKHPTYISRVLGEFAWDAGPTLISPEEMAVALDTDVLPDDDQPVLGVDVSRSAKGDMNTVYRTERGIVFPAPEGTPLGEVVRGEKIRFVDAWNQKDAMKTAVRINEIALAEAAWLVYIDGSGLGGPIADRVRELAEGRYHVWDAMGGMNDMSEVDKNRYYNNRAQWYSGLRHKIAGGLVDIDVEDDKLQEELLGIETKFPARGVQKLLIESKEDMRKRGVGSPDYADAALYSQIDYEQFNPWQAPREVNYDPEYFDEYAEPRTGGYLASI